MPVIKPGTKTKPGTPTKPGKTPTKPGKGIKTIPGPAKA